MALSIVQLLKGIWAEIVQSRVKPTPIIEGFDVEEKRRLGFGAGGKHGVMHPLAFQRAEEAFHRGVVIPVINAVHTDLDIIDL